jgi:hypothetical protein
VFVGAIATVAENFLNWQKKRFTVRQFPYTRRRVYRTIFLDFVEAVHSDVSGSDSSNVTRFDPKSNDETANGNRVGCMHDRN